MKINCVVVTYNRLPLLKECLNALKGQTVQLSGIWIIDNCSTDETAAYLETLKNDTKYHIIRTEKNIGGAGGFALGTQLATEDGADYVWLMDDDTIAQPDALEHLLCVADGDKNIGFLCSKVLWTDGTLHAMNKPNIDERANVLTINGRTCYKCLSCSFVSVLISTDAVYKVGLPIKEFFIWCDDVEYTDRIYRAGYTCYSVPSSKVYHKTRLNYFPSIDLAPSEMVSRFYYQVRNTCYLKRRSVGRLRFYIAVLNKYRLYIHRLKRREDKSNYEELKKYIKKGCLDGLHFNPKITYLRKR